MLFKCDFDGRLSSVELIALSSVELQIEQEQKRAEGLAYIGARAEI